MKGVLAAPPPIAWPAPTGNRADRRARYHEAGVWRQYATFRAIRQRMFLAGLL